MVFVANSCVCVDSHTNTTSVILGHVNASSYFFSDDNVVMMMMMIDCNDKIKPKVNSRSIQTLIQDMVISKVESNTKELNHN